MARLVESVVADYGETVRWEKVITKDLVGAKRFLTLSKELGRMAPVPSIYIDGKLAFDTTPGSDELKECLNRLISA
ncbi:MAG: hypothetical protein HN366_11650 [Deltaproteobacteria bacterium]|jgi:hypothetical protein|nr:hypothetical protein [Deltaproteobacteria bacterium]